MIKMLVMAMLPASITIMQVRLAPDGGNIDFQAGAGLLHPRARPCSLTSIRMNARSGISQDDKDDYETVPIAMPGSLRCCSELSVSYTKGSPKTLASHR